MTQAMQVAEVVFAGMHLLRLSFGLNMNRKDRTSEYVTVYPKIIFHISCAGTS